MIFWLLDVTALGERQGRDRYLQQEKGFNYLEQEHVLKSKDFRLSVHGTKGRCVLCTRVAESLYSALFFFCGSYFLLLTRVLYLEPPSYWMMASSQKVWLKLSKAYFTIFSLALICGGPLLDKSSKQQMHFPYQPCQLTKTCWGAEGFPLNISWKMVFQ